MFVLYTILLTVNYFKKKIQIYSISNIQSVQITRMIDFYFYLIETPPSKQKLIPIELSQTFPGTSFKRKLDFGTNKCKSLSPKPKKCSKLFLIVLEFIV